MPPWTNIWLLMAMALSFGLHFVLLYVETLSVSFCFFQFPCLTYFSFFSKTVFSVCPLTVEEWWVVMKISLPVLLLDETLKLIARKFIDGNKSKSEIIYLTAAWAAFFAMIRVS